jgi:hypothetical protein
VNSKSHSREREKKREKRYKKPRKTFGKSTENRKEKNSFHVKKTLCGAISKAGLTIKHPGF